jgi:tetratricopeptide (TPR) repeat protein
VARSIDPLSGGDEVNFGDLPEAVNDLLQQGVAAHRRDYARADALFRQALAAAPHVLPTYYCLYKIHTYRGHLDEALAVARAGLQEAARQAGWRLDWREWSVPIAPPEAAARFARYTLKAIGFIYLRRNEPEQARRILDGLARLDPRGTVGWPVVAALADAVT